MPTTNKSQQLVVTLLLMVFAFYMQELPTSNVLQKVLPEWPFILSLYLAVSSRYFFGVVSAFVVGVIQDVFLGIPTMGLHAAIYVLCAFFLISTRLRFKYLSIFFQSLIIGVLVAFKVLVLMLYETILYSPPTHLWVLLSIPLSMLVWPLVHMFFAFFSETHTV